MEDRKPEPRELQLSSIKYPAPSITTRNLLPKIWHHTLNKISILLSQPLPFISVFEEITDKDYLTVFHFQYGDAFVFIGLFSPINSAIGPMHSRLISLVNYSYYRKYQFGVLAKKYIQKFQNAIFANYQLSFWKEKFCLGIKQIVGFLKVTRI